MYFVIFGRLCSNNSDQKSRYLRPMFDRKMSNHVWQQDLSTLSTTEKNVRRKFFVYLLCRVYWRSGTLRKGAQMKCPCMEICEWWSRRMTSIFGISSWKDRLSASLNFRFFDSLWTNLPSKQKSSIVKCWQNILWNLL